MHIELETIENGYLIRCSGNIRGNDGRFAFKHDEETKLIEKLAKLLFDKRCSIEWR